MDQFLKYCIHAIKLVLKIKLFRSPTSFFSYGKYKEHKKRVVNFFANHVYTKEFIIIKVTLLVLVPTH